MPIKTAGGMKTAPNAAPIPPAARFQPAAIPSHKRPSRTFLPRVNILKINAYIHITVAADPKGLVCMIPPCMALFDNK